MARDVRGGGRKARGHSLARGAPLSILLLWVASVAAADETAWTKAPWDSPAFRLRLPVERLQGSGAAAPPTTTAPSPAPPSSLAGPAGLWHTARPADDASTPPSPPPSWAAAHSAAVAAAPALACDVCLALAERAWNAGVAWVGTEGGTPPAPHRIARHMRASCDAGTGPPGGATPLGAAPKAALAGAGVAEVEGGGGGSPPRYARYARTTASPQQPTRLEADAARQACLSLTDGAAPPLPGPGAGGGGAAYASPGPPAASVLGATTPLPPAAAAVSDALAALARRTAAAYASVGRPPPRGKSTKLHGVRSSSLTAVAAGCADLHPECGAWAARGECERNVRYMVGDLALDDDRPRPRSFLSEGGERQQHWRGHCRLACGLCAPQGDQLPAPLEGEAGAGLAAAAASLKAAALLRACVAAPPCGGSTADAAVAKAALAAVAGGASLSSVGGEAQPARRPDPPAQQGPPLGLGAFADKCFLIPAGFWTFEACPGVSVRQARLALGSSGGGGGAAPPLPSHSLGLSVGAVDGGAVQTMPAEEVPPGLIDAGPIRFVAERFAGGDECERGTGDDGATTTVPRSAILRLACPPDGAVRATVGEPETCSYVLTLFHPDACELTGGGSAGTGGVAAEPGAGVDEAQPAPPRDDDGGASPFTADSGDESDDAEAIPALPATEEDPPPLPPPLRDEL